MQYQLVVRSIKGDELFPKEDESQEAKDARGKAMVVVHVTDLETREETSFSTPVLDESRIPELVHGALVHAGEALRAKENGGKTEEKKPMLIEPGRIIIP